MNISMSNLIYGFKKTKNSYLTFELGGELFSISVFKVIEIIEFPVITKVPNSPEYLLGVINLRGNVIPLVDTRHKFSMDGVEARLTISGGMSEYPTHTESVRELIEFADQAMYATKKKNGNGITIHQNKLNEDDSIS